MRIRRLARQVAGKAGSILDADDRKLLVQGLVLSGTFLWVAAMLGLGVRVFSIAMGG